MSPANAGDPRLSRFDPLERIFFYDDFDEGIRGWSELIGNYEHTFGIHAARIQRYAPAYA